VNVRIEAEPADAQFGSNYGSMQFSEEASLTGAGFEAVSKVFTRMHDLLTVVKAEHSNSAPGAKRA